MRMTISGIQYDNEEEKKEYLKQSRLLLERMRKEGLIKKTKEVQK